jgi:hypothetical protein
VSTTAGQLLNRTCSEVAFRKFIVEQPLAYAAVEGLLRSISPSINLNREEFSLREFLLRSCDSDLPSPKRPCIHVLSKSQNACPVNNSLIVQKRMPSSGDDWAGTTPRAAWWLPRSICRRTIEF